MQLYFIRHGQSINNANWNNPGYQENPDPCLTELGRKQARRLARYLKGHQSITDENNWNIQNRDGFGLTHLYTSLMERAVGTAAHLAHALPGIPFEAWPEIHEEGGIFSHEDKTKPMGLPGKPRSFFEKNFPALILPEALDESGWWNRPFEYDEERGPRAARFLTELLARHGDQDGRAEQRIAIVSHGGFFVQLMCALLDLPHRQASHHLKSWFLLNNCSISRFDLGRGDMLVAYLNRTDHLPDHLVTA